MLARITPESRGRCVCRGRASCRLDNPPMIAERIGRSAVAALVLAGCSPALDWREVRPADSGAVALFPCKPQHMRRTIDLAGGPLTLDLSACTTGAVTYALVHADVGDPRRVGPTLEALRSAAAANLGGEPRVLGAMAVPGMTPNPLAERLEVEGRDARGNNVREHVGFFVKGVRVYQATVVGAGPDAAAVETFFSALNLP